MGAASFHCRCLTSTDPRYQSARQLLTLPHPPCLAEIAAGRFEILLVVLDDPRKRQDLFRPAPAARILDVSSCLGEIPAGVVVPRTPVQGLIDVVELQIDHARGRVDRLFMTPKLGQADRSSGPGVLVRGLQREGPVVQLDGAVPIGDRVLERSAEKRGRGRAGQPLQRFGHKSVRIARAAFGDRGHSHLAQEERRFDESRNVGRSASSVGRCTTPQIATR